ncbi:MAG: hypothetical protein E7Z72_06975 [Methanocorpusculum parvum]|nr:hypothetical protein [Methanocorpusculum parvum]
MKKLIIPAVLLLLAVLGAGCVNIGETEPGKIIPEIPPVSYPPNTIQPIVGEWEGYDTGSRTSYELTCLYDGYAKLDIEVESGNQEREYVYRGAWEGENPNYQLRLDYGNYAMQLAGNGKTAELTAPDGAKILMTYESF